MTGPFAPEPDFSPAELKFLSSLKKLFRKEGGMFPAIQQQVYTAIEKELANPGESTIEAVKRASAAVLIKKHSEVLKRANEEVRASYSNYHQLPSDETRKHYQRAAENLRTVNQDIFEDGKEAYAYKTEKLAKKAGLQSETEITKAEKRFLKSLRQLLANSNDAFIHSNYDVYNALAKELSKKGQSTLEDITKIAETALGHNPPKKDALTGRVAKENDPLTVPHIQKLAEQSGIKRSE